MSGKLIVLEGLDGCGKSTQFELLEQSLRQKGKVKAISFPDYAQPSSALVKMYLNGELSSDARDVNAFAASSFYAVDRYASFKRFWQADYEAGTLILAARYSTSNAIYQMAKMPVNEWDGFLVWLEDYEYGKLGLPRPDCVIFLDLSVELAQTLLKKRYQGDESKKDLHEKDLDFLRSCRQAAVYAARYYGWRIVSCGEGNTVYGIEEIHERIQSLVSEILG